MGNVSLTTCCVVDRDEVDRLRKRFMKLDKVRFTHGIPMHFTFHQGFSQAGSSHRGQDNSGTVDRDEFLSLPQVSSNPLANR